MGKRKTGLALALVFVSGIVIGGVGSRIVSHRLRTNPEKLHRIVMRRMNRRLDLRDDQYPQVAAEITETLASLRNLHDRTQMEFVRILDETGTQLEPILDEAQAAKLAKMLSDLHAHVDVQQLPPPQDFRP